MTDFTMETGADGVSVITWDVPGKSMNVMTLEAWDELDTLVDQALADNAVKGVVITSGKDSFAGGMDLKVIAKMKEMAGDDPAKGLFDGIMNAHRIMRKIERAGMDPKTLKGGKPIATQWAFWKLHDVYSLIIREGEQDALLDQVKELRKKYGLKTLY